MRPLYVTTEDVEKADDVAQSIKSIVHPAWRVRKAVDDTRMYDYRLWDSKTDRAKALVEVKNRTNTKNKYPTYIISKFKVDNCIQEAVKAGAVFILVVRWSDTTGWVAFNVAEEFPVRSGGRFDRNDQGDIEDVYHIPIRVFRSLPEMVDLLFEDESWRVIL